MSVHPVLVDSRPPYLGRRSRTPSLLLLPIGTDTLIGDLATRLATVTAYRPVVVPPVGCGPRYAEQIAAAAPGARVLESPARISDLLGTLEPSDTLLLIDPRSYPAEGFDPAGAARGGASGPALGRALRYR